MRPWPAATCAREPGKVRERIGYVSQSGGTDPLVDGRTELIFQGRLYGLSTAEAQRRAAELLALA